MARPPAHAPHATPAADVLAAQQPTTRWSAPAGLSACAAAQPPRVVFPSDRPSHGTGAGAIVWGASAACAQGEGARVAALGANDAPGVAAMPKDIAGHALAPRGAILAGGAPHGQIAIAGTSSTRPARGLVIQGAAAGPFAALRPIGGASAPIALATAYLGDLGLAASPAGGALGRLDVHVERYFAHDFVNNVAGALAPRRRVQALTLAMDFRGEALAVWTQGGVLYTRLVNNRGSARTPQRLATVGADTRIAAVLSDDNRAIVAWAQQRGTQTSVYIDRSAPGVRFRSPQLLERFRDPDGLSSPTGSPSLVRLSSESVMLAWAGSAAGHWAVRVAPVDLNGVQSVSTIAAPGEDALLSDLAAGPDDDALLLWTEPLPTAGGSPDMQRQALFAARGTDAPQDRVAFGEPEQVSPPAPVRGATVALDPNDDRALAAWLGEGARVEYSIRGAGATP